MTEHFKVVVVQFKWGRLGDYKCKFDVPVNVHDFVIVEAPCCSSDGRPGRDLGVVHSIDTLAEPEECKCKWGVVRAATEGEQDEWLRKLVIQERAAREKAQEIVQKKGGPDIQIHHAEYRFDKKTVTLHYSSPQPKPNFSRTIYTEFGCKVVWARYSGEALERYMINLVMECNYDHTSPIPIYPEVDAVLRASADPLPFGAGEWEGNSPTVRPPTAAQAPSSTVTVTGHGHGHRYCHVL